MEKTGNRWKVWNTEINDKETENPSHLLPPSEVATNDGMVWVNPEGMESVGL